MEERKLKERAYHNLKRTESEDTAEHTAYVSSQRKWYSIVRSSVKCWEDWLEKNCPNKRVLDYGSGNGDSSIKMIELGASRVDGIDISDLSVENAVELAAKKGMKERVRFHVMDAEKMDFEDDSFDLICESGVLHHLDLGYAYPELARVLKKDGSVICAEALGHNPVIHRYRKRTPELRTEWEAEHILKKKDIDLARNYFNKVNILGFYHLATIAAVPFRNNPHFNKLLTIFEKIDKGLLKIPFLKWQAWQVIFVLSEPKI